MIAVIGSTGRIGRHVMAGLAAAGAPTRALVRDPASAVFADLAQPDTLPVALDGVERLLLVTPHGADQERLEAAAIDAAAAAGVRHIVKVSGGPATLGPNGVAPTAIAHWRSEQRIERSGMGFTFLRCSFFMDNLLDVLAPAAARTGVLAAPFARAPIAMVDVRDVAACAVAVLLDAAPADAAWHITGRRAVTLETAAAHLGLRHRSVPHWAATRALSRAGASAWEIDHAQRMARYLAAGSDGIATDHVLRLTGAQPRTLAAYLDEHRSAFAPATGLARVLSTATTKAA